MDNTIETNEAKKAGRKATGVSIMVRRETRRKLNKIMRDINKKEYGRDLEVDDFIEQAISLFGASEIQSLQEKSLSNSDKLTRQYKEYVSKHGATSWDAFLGKLLEMEKNKDGLKSVTNG